MGVNEAPTVVEVPISSKSLRPRQQERVREALKALRALRTNQTELAADLGVKQQTVSKALANGTIGMKLARAVAEARAQTFEELVGGAAARRTYAELDGWPEAAREAEARGESPAAIAAVSRWPASVVLARVEWRFVSELAAFWRRWAPAEEREEEETVDAQREAEVTRPPSTAAPGVHRRGRKMS